MPRPFPLRTLLAAGLLVLPLSGAATEPTPAPASALIEATDLFKVRQLESPAFSPDGKWIAYVVRSIEPKPDTPDDWAYETHLWLAATDGSTPPRQLTRQGNDTSPAWSPAGDRIAFVRAHGADKPQIYVLPLAGGEALPLTRVATGAGNPRWSPDGTRLLFSSTLTYGQVRAALGKAGAKTTPSWTWERPGRKPNDAPDFDPKAAVADRKKEGAAAATPEHTKLALAKADGTLAERREWLARNEADGNPRPLTRLNFQTESDINPELSFPHLFVQEARPEAEAKDLTPGYTGYFGAEWMRDGKGIVCVGPADPALNPDRNERSSLWLVDPAGGGVKPFCALKDYTLGRPQPSPDGKWVALTAQPGEPFGYGQAVVAVVPAAGGEPKLLTAALDRGAGALRWAPDSASLFFVAPTNGAFPIYRCDPSSGVTQRLTKDESLGVDSFDTAGGVLAEVVTGPTNPAELHRIGLRGGSDKVLTSHNSSWLAGKKLSAYEAHSLVNKEGLTIQYWTMKPTEFDAKRKYPLLVEVHGGPQAMWGPGEDSMWFEFQYFAARGFALVFSNPRGSGGYGYDFQRANHKDWGTGPASDILAAADFAAKQPYVDRHRQVLTGGSYGGYMTAWLVGHDNRFKAAVAQRGVYDLATFFGEGNAWRLVPRAFGGYPWEPETHRLLERESPITYVESITTPLLIQHGDNDRRTGFVQSEMLLRSLKVLGRDVEEVRYPRATHELSRSGEPRQRLDTLVRYEEFFRRYIGEN